MTPALAEPATSDRMDAAACGACHEAARRVWEESAHARALEALPPARRTDVRCLGCHTTTSDQAGVQCEACHGPVARHVPVGRRGKRTRTMAVDRATCLRCHTPDAPRVFQWERALAEIAHGDEERAR